MNRSRRALTDLLSQVSAVAIYAVSAVVFLGVAVAGISMTTRLGGAGWFIYVVVMLIFSLMFGPLVASAARISQKGNPRWRSQRDKRVEADRTKFGMSLDRQRERDRPGERDPDAD